MLLSIPRLLVHSRPSAGVFVGRASEQRRIVENQFRYAGLSLQIGYGPYCVRWRLEDQPSFLRYSKASSSMERDKSLLKALLVIIKKTGVFDEVPAWLPAFTI